MIISSRTSGFDCWCGFSWTSDTVGASSTRRVSTSPPSRLFNESAPETGSTDHSFRSVVLAACAVTNLISRPSALADNRVFLSVTSALFTFSGEGTKIEVAAPNKKSSRASSAGEDGDACEGSGTATQSDNCAGTRTNGTGTQCQRCLLGARHGFRGGRRYGIGRISDGNADDAKVRPLLRGRQGSRVGEMPRHRRACGENERQQKDKDKTRYRVHNQSLSLERKDLA